MKRFQLVVMLSLAMWNQFSNPAVDIDINELLSPSNRKPAENVGNMAQALNTLFKCIYCYFIFVDYVRASFRDVRLN